MPVMAAAPAPAITVPHRRGNRLVVPRGAGGLPPFCVRCGGPATKFVDKTFQWHNPWYYLLVVPGVLIYAVVAAIVIKRMRFGVPLCREHATQRPWMILLATLAVFGSVPFAIFVGTAVPGDAGVWVGLAAGLIGFVGSVIWLQRVLNMIQPKRIDEERGEFVGVSDAFFRNLPVEAMGR